MFLRSKEFVRCDQLLPRLHTLDRRSLDLTGRGGHTYGQGGRRMGLKRQRGEGRTARCLGVVGVLLSTVLGAECRKP